MNRPGTAARDLAFPDIGDLAHLDTATMGVLPGEAAAALHDAITQWTRGTGDHGVWEAAAEEARGLVAGLIGMSACDVALLPSHVAAAATVARAWPHARVVVPEEEFRANLLPWIADRDRGAVRLVPPPATTDALCAAVDQGADLVAVSSVQSADGLRVDLPRLVEHAHDRGALVYVDASQSLGVDATLRRSGADFIAAVGYKWLLGARGTAFLAVRPEHQRRFAPVLSGPESCADGAIYGAEHRLWDDARRFDQPQGWHAWVATAASLRHLCAYDQAELERHATGLAGRFVEAVHALGAATAPADVPSAIVGVAHRDPQVAVQRLRDAGVRAAARAESIRFAFHLYTTERDVDRAIAALAATTGSTT